LCAFRGCSYKPLNLQDILVFADRRTGSPLAAGQLERRAGAADRRRAARFVGLGLLCLGMAAPASAQIYSWRDANGNLVLSNRRQNSAATEVQSYAVPKADSVRATRYAAADKARAYEDIINEHSRNHGVRPALVKAVMQVESAFNPMARSPKGALGLMQLMPATIQQYRVTDPFDPRENVRGGVAYLRHLLDRYENNEQLALAAYNAGPGAVDKYKQSVPPYRETRNYVAQISQMTDVSDSAARPIAVRGNSIYKVTEVIDGRTVVRYTDKKPTTGAVDVVGGR
jgi:soluble lytic murein transglycosylase-like protein